MGAQNVRPQTLLEWRMLFGGIYGEHNRKGYSLEQIEIQLWQQHSKIAKCIRKNDTGELGVQLAVFFGWFMAYLERLGLSIEEVAWHKYPNVCLTCFVSHDCVCIRNKRKYDPRDQRVNVYRRDTRNIFKTLPELQDMADRLFATINGIQSVENIWFHLVEEIGEMSTEVARWDVAQPIPDTLKEECGDVCLWLLSFCTRAGIRLDQVAWETYPGECNICRKEKCDCPFPR